MGVLRYTPTENRKSKDRAEPVIFGYRAALRYWLQVGTGKSGDFTIRLFTMRLFESEVD